MKDNSAKSVNDYINRLKIHFHATDLTFLKDTSDIIDFMEKTPTRLGGLPSNNSLKTYYAHIVSAIRDSNEPVLASALEVYRKKMMEKKGIAVEQSLTQATTEAEQSKWASWSDIIKARDQLKEKAKDFKSFQNYLVVCLYTMIEPQRLDFAPMRFVSTVPPKVEGERDFNVCHITDKGATFIFNEFKTKEWYEKRYGETKKIEATPELFAVLSLWREKYNHKDWLLLKLDEQTPISEKTLGQRIQAIFEAEIKIPVSVDILRHAFISHRRSGEMSISDKAVMAKRMGHSEGTNELYRRIV
jgi:hypothetical protein